MIEIIFNLVAFIVGLELILLGIELQTDIKFPIVTHIGVGLLAAGII